jgi:glycerol-3-phosphate dehydrogenase (NAD(P)+)
MKSSTDHDAPADVFARIGVAGAGAWGTALALCARAAGRDVALWAHESEVARSLAEGGGNPLYLPGVSIPPMTASADMGVLADCDAILMAAPAQHMRATLRGVAPGLRAGTPVALCSKGIERGTLKLMTDILREEAPGARPAVLSGPSFASDVARGLPTAVTLACEGRALAESWTASIGRPHFRIYWSDDLTGAEVGGAIKNVLAIACGVCEGMGLGRSAHAALIARGFAEMTRLGIALGGRPETLSGLCGLGDLVLTCSSSQSRNMSFGMELGRGRSPGAILAARTAVTEGAETAPALIALGARLGVELPICEVVLDMIEGRLDAKSAVDRLLNRPMGGEG